MNNERWKSIPGYTNQYEASNIGRIRSLHGTINKIKLMKYGINKDGYYTIGLTKNNKQRLFRVHRIIANTFILNPNNKPCINHKDCNRKNNVPKNLEWCTPTENNKHSICNKNGKRNPTYLKEIICKNCGRVKSYRMHISRIPYKFCSISCGTIWNNKHSILGTHAGKKFKQKFAEMKKK